MKATHTLHTTSGKLRASSALRSLDKVVARLKKSVSRRLTSKYGSIPIALVRRALDDAEELARGTGFPHLFFPALAEEKVLIVSGFLPAEATPRKPQSLLFAA